MQNKIPDIPIHDIKPLIEIQEYSFYYLLALIVFALFLIAGLVYLLVKYIKQRNAYNIRKEHFKLLNKIKFKDPKKSAYELTFYAATFKDDSPRHAEIYQELLERLERYKYRKSVDKFDKEIKNYVDQYRGMIDV